MNTSLRTNLRAVSIVVLSTLSIAIASCTEGNTITSPEQIIFPDSLVSYRSSVQPFLQLSCGYTGCHNEASSIPLVSYVDLFSRAGLVTPGKPETSTLSQLIAGKLSHSVNFQRTLTENHKLGIATWIREGAKNN